MRILLFISCAFILTNCQGEKEVDEVTGNLMEIQPDQLELDEIALEEQPETVQDFFAVNSDLIGDDYCYNYSSISQLILYGNDSNDEWKKFELSDNYLTAYHNECDVLLEFMTFDLNGEKKAFLSQMNSVNQQFDYLSWNTKTERWVKINRYPRPALSDYFDFLERNDADIVNEYGSDYIYINPNSSSATYVFSESNMHLNMGEKEQLTLTENPKYYYELATDESALTLTKVPMKTSETSTSYFIACSASKEPSHLFTAKYESLILELSDNDVQHQITTYGENDFKVNFDTDTLMLNSAELLESSDYFWFFKTGQSPLVIEVDQNIELIINQAKNYFETELD